jgi:hypothetical protein
MKAIKPLFAAVAIGVGCIVLSPLIAGSQAVSDYERVAKIVHRGPSDGCSGDTCVGGVMDPVTANFSTVGDRFRVIASVSLAYRTSVGDGAEVSLLWRPKGSSRFREASPGPSPLMPSHARTTVSISWSITGLAAGNQYEFAVGVRGIPATPGEDFNVTTKDLVLQLEAA